MSDTTEGLTRFGDIEVEGRTFEVFINSHGVFSLKLGDEWYENPALDGLRRDLSGGILGARIEAPFYSLEGRRGWVRGFHAQNRDALVSWEDGEKGRLKGYDEIIPADAITGEQLAEVRGLVAEREKLDRQAKAITQSLRAIVKPISVKTRDLITAQIGEDLFSSRS